MNPFTQKPALGSLPRNGHWSTIDRTLALDILAKGDFNNYGTDKLTVTNGGATPINGPNGGGALSFAGDDISLGSLDISSLRQITMVCIFRITTTTAWAPFIMQTSAFNQDIATGLYMSSSTGNILVGHGLSGGGRVQEVSTMTVNDGAVYHVVGTLDFDSQEANLYINGENKGTEASGFAGKDPLELANTTNLGGHTSWTGALTGDIYKMDVYNSILTAPQVKSLFDDPWQAYRRSNIAILAAAAGGVVPPEPTDGEDCFRRPVRFATDWELRRCVI